MAYLGKTPSQAVRSRYYFTATGGETSLSGADDNSNVLAFSDGNYVDVSLNGVALVAGTDYNTTTANTIGGLTALVASDVIEVIVYDTFSVFSGNVNSNFSVGGDLSVTGTSSFGNNIDVTGTVTADAATIDSGVLTVNDAGTRKVEISGNGFSDFTSNPVLDGGIEFTNQFGHVFSAGVSNSNNFDVLDGATKIARFSGGGDISFYDSTGVSQGFFWDASTQSLGLGTTSPVVPLQVKASSPAVSLQASASKTSGSRADFNAYNSDVSTVGYIRFGAVTDNVGTDIQFANRPAGGSLTERLRITSDGNVGIGTSSPSFVNGGGAVIYNATAARLKLGDAVSGVGSADGLELVYDDAAYVWNRESTSLVFGTNATERLRIDSSGNVGIGTTSPSEVLDVNGIVKSSNTFQSTSNRTEGAGWQYNSTTMGYSSDNNYGWITAAGASGRTNLALNAGGGKVGIGTSSPTKTLSVHGNDGSPLYLQGSGNDTAIVFAHSGTVNSAINASSDGALEFRVSGSGAVNEAGRFDASGNLLVGKTAVDSNAEGFEAESDGKIAATRDGARTAIFNRLTSDGEIVAFRKDGSTVGSIGSDSSYPYFESATNVGLTMFSYVQPRNNGSAADNIVDLGSGSFRFDDIYATNGTIQTSDQNEKQQIASLTDAEITAAKAISQLFKTFKWNSSVTERGDAARTHTGVIAQDVEAAMTAAGLDAGDYAFFISADWYVDADGNEVEADAEGAIAKNRKGIRYPELLSFVGAATEQRLANIETRLAALENA